MQSVDNPAAIQSTSVPSSPIVANLLGTCSALPSILSPLPSPTWPTFDRGELARRHSISLINRTPPSGSLAEELLAPSPSASLQNLKLISSIKDITEALSDFNSCMSSFSSNDGSDNETVQPNKDLKKRKRKKSPKQKEQLKKMDLKVTPNKEQ